MHCGFLLSESILEVIIYGLKGFIVEKTEVKSKRQLIARAHLANYY